MFESIIAFVGGKAAAVGIGVGIPLALAAALRYGPKYLGREAGKLIAKALDPNTTDPVEKKLVQDVALALIKLAEYEIPDRGQGKERYQKVVERLVALIPALKGNEARLEQIIEEGVAQMDEALKSANQIKP